MKKLGDNIYLTEDNRIFNSKKQTLSTAPNCLFGKTTKGGNTFVKDFYEFSQLQNGKTACFPFHCDTVEKRSKSYYAKSLDIELLINGKRPINNIWIAFNFNIKKGLNFILAKRNDNYPNSIEILKTHAL